MSRIRDGNTAPALSLPAFSGYARSWKGGPTSPPVLSVLSSSSRSFGKSSRRISAIELSITCWSRHWNDSGSRGSSTTPMPAGPAKARTGPSHVYNRACDASRTTGRRPALRCTWISAGSFSTSTRRSCFRFWPGAFGMRRCCGWRGRSSFTTAQRMPSSRPTGDCGGIFRRTRRCSVPRIGAALLGSVAHRVPQSLEDFVTFPPVGVVVEINPIQILL